jgi:hypothetical protein
MPSKKGARARQFIGRKGQRDLSFDSFDFAELGFLKFYKRFSPAKHFLNFFGIRQLFCRPYVGSFDHRGTIHSPCLRRPGCSHHPPAGCPIPCFGLELFIEAQSISKIRLLFSTLSTPVLMLFQGHQIGDPWFQG